MSYIRKVPALFLEGRFRPWADSDECPPAQPVCYFMEEAGLNLPLILQINGRKSA